MNRTRQVLAVAAIAAGLGLTTTGVAMATQGADHKGWICHPVEGNGETGYGWNLIEPDKASSHIDEATGAGKHTRSNGDTDVYVDEGGHCPGYVPQPSESSSPTPSPSQSDSPSPSPSASVSPSPSVSVTPTPPSPSATATSTARPTPTVPSPSRTVTRSARPTPTVPSPSRTVVRVQPAPASSTTAVPVTQEPPSGPTSLAQTGSNLPLLAAVAGMALLLIGGGAVASSARARKH